MRAEARTRNPPGPGNTPREVFFFSFSTSCTATQQALAANSGLLCNKGLGQPLEPVADDLNVCFIENKPLARP